MYRYGCIYETCIDIDMGVLWDMYRYGYVYETCIDMGIFMRHV